jgi:hypothetical protein|tara:strand:+ start:522 stop:698 length:177 start_codon:yes stop_codon:yes gene_type:complete
MRIKGGGYISYLTHSYCKLCELWQSKENQVCEECNRTTRKNPHYRGKNVKDTRWDNAY